jgi:hypothetical protein
MMKAVVKETSESSLRRKLGELAGDELDGREKRKLVELLGGVIKLPIALCACLGRSGDCIVEDLWQEGTTGRKSPSTQAMARDNWRRNAFQTPRTSAPSIIRSHSLRHGIPGDVLKDILSGFW